MTIKFKQIKIFPYNPEWPRMFEEEAKLIQQELARHFLEVHHIGSTSVPGLTAKEDLDILCVVDNLRSSLQLQNADYIFKGEFNIPLRYFFSKNTSHSKVNLHVVERNHGFISLNLSFRDYLREHEEARLAYARLKQDLLQDPKSYQKIDGRFTGYTLGKDLFIKGILDRAGFEELTINFCLHNSEWEAYHRISEEQPPTITTKNHYHFVLYKGTRIVSVAHVELASNQETYLRHLITDKLCNGHNYEIHLLSLIEKWARFHGKQLGIPLRTS